MLHVPVIMDTFHDDVIKWKHFPRYWPFVRGIHRSPVNSPHNGQWRGALMFSLICVWINGWVNNREAGDLRRYRAHYYVNVMRAFTMILHERHGFENHQQPDCLFNRLFWLVWKIKSPCHWPFVWRISRWLVGSLHKNASETTLSKRFT